MFPLALDIDPVDIATKAYTVGNIQLVCLILLGIIIVIVFRFLFKRLEKLDARVVQVEDSKTKILEGVVRENSTMVRDGSTAIVRAGDRQTAAINQLIAVIGELPCSGASPGITPPSRRHRTPLPQQYPQP